MRMLVRTVVAALLAAPVLSTFAADVTMRPYIAESLLYSFSDSSRNSENGVGGYLGGGIPLNRWFNLELGGSYTHYNADDDSPPSNPWREYIAHIEGQYFYSRNHDFSPYLALGGGYSVERMVATSNKDHTAEIDLGVGAIHYFRALDWDFGVRGDARYRVTFADSDKFPGRGVDTFGEPVLSLGLIIPLTRGTVPAALPEPLPPPAQPMPKPQAVTVDPNRRFEDVNFAFDKSTLTPHAQQSLDGDAATIRDLSDKFPSLKVNVAGHTDWIGTDAYNQALSERRARAVKEYLIRKGVDAGRIHTYAYGESQPVAPNTTREGRALNRRTEIRTSE